MLNSINLSQPLISIILSYISSTSLAVIVNGKPSEYFEPSWVSGKVLFPYLFILEIKFLSIFIHNQIRFENWKPIKISKLGPSISHTHLSQMTFSFSPKLRWNMLLPFIQSSTTLPPSVAFLSIQLNPKSFFPPSCPSEICNAISNQLGFSQTKTLGNYLGFPLLSCQPMHGDFNPIIHKITNKLTSWKSKLLNMAGHNSRSYHAMPLFSQKKLPIL